MSAIDPPTNIGASPADAPPPRRSNRRLKALLAVNALGFALYAFTQLDRTTASRLGPWAENLYSALRDLDLDAPSAAATRFKGEVKALGGTPTVHVLKSGFLGYFGRVETYSAQFDGPAFDDAALARFAESHGARIFNLNLSNTSVTDDGLRHLEGMTNLRHFGINYYGSGRNRPATQSKITDAGLVRVGKISQLESLSLSDVPVTDAGLAAIKDLPALASLFLRRTDVQGPGLAHLQSLPVLNYLYIHADVLTNDGLKALAGVTFLQDLTLDGVALTPEQLPLLTALSRLRYLCLHGCGLLDEELDALRKARPSLTVRN